MYKLLVVDDEKIVRDSIEYIVSNNLEELIEVEVAKTGYEAIEKSAKKHPDIVFMDINMPGINGIETIKEIKTINKEVECYVISAYDHFDFAKEAIELEVLEYILKPINKNKIIEVLQNSINKIKIKREKKLVNIKNREKMEKVLPSLEQNFIFKLLLSPYFSDEIDAYKDIFDIKEEGGFILIINFIEKNRDKLNEKFNFTYEMQKLYSYARNKVKFKLNCIWGPIINNRVILFIPKFKKNEKHFDRLTILEESKKISEIIKRKSELEFEIGIGGYKTLSKLKKSYEEALKAILFSESEISYIGDIIFEKTKFSKIKGFKKKIIEDLKINKVDNIDSYIDEMINLMESLYLMEDGKFNINGYKTSLIEFLVKLYDEITFEEDIEKNNGKDSYIFEIMSFKYRFNIKNWLKTKLKEIVELIEVNKEYNYSENTKSTIAYIYKNYKEEISLEEISRELFITPQYLSKIFKNEIGKTFIDFLTEFRINKAKKFLEQSNYTIKEICYEVGYNDPNYFSRIFKKEVKVTPKEYRKKLK